MKDIPYPMRIARKPKMTSGRGEAWFYVSKDALEICVAGEKGNASDNCFAISKAQLYRAIQIMEAAQ